ncbi:MAG: outer membrane protein assembly factor BamD [Chthoniobacterales bacterium]|nr:outer membrane protein assembly factor BamD [Chthoniobacterales bacterium]
MAQTVVPSTSGANNAEAAALLQQARDLEAAGSTGRSVSIYREVVKKYPVSPSASAAQFRLAELIEQSGNPSRAFDEYKKFVEGYPQAREFEQAANAQLAIADDFMQRKRYERADEMYRAILGSAPYAKFAPAAQFKLGQSLESRNEYDQAVAAYQIILDRYGSSDYADDALYQIGYVQLSEARSRSQDLSAAIDAKNTFEEFLMEYPNSEKAAQARENLDLMTGRESGDLFAIARFYDRNNNFRAAVIYYADLVRRQPGSENAKLANERIEEIRAEFGEDELRSGPERAETGERAAMRRRLQNQVETSALSNYAGPPVDQVEPPEELPAPRPQLRTSANDVQPLQPEENLPPVEPELPVE